MSGSSANGEVGGVGVGVLVAVVPVLACDSTEDGSAGVGGGGVVVSGSTEGDGFKGGRSATGVGVGGVEVGDVPVLACDSTEDGSAGVGAVGGAGVVNLGSIFRSILGVVGVFGVFVLSSMFFLIYNS